MIYFKKGMINMKKIFALILSVCLLFCCFTSCSSNYSSTSYNDDDYKQGVDNWMADQAEGKDYDYDDGGSYYCMGKGDTCSRKTNNAYDLYCSSCDPDGDNIEG